MLEPDGARISMGAGGGTIVLTLERPPTRVSSIHLLINAGGGYKEYEGYTLEGLQVGKIRMEFDDQASQETRVILGGNVREWAIGNFPDELVDIVTDNLCQEVFRGLNTSSRAAVVDHLEIPILQRNRRKTLSRIVFTNVIEPHTPAAIVAFFVSAVTLERW